jgi:hypothetical protein
MSLVDSHLIFLDRNDLPDHGEFEWKMDSQKLTDPLTFISGNGGVSF